METINNAAAGVSKMIWGESKETTTATNETAGTEPISGEQGKGTVTEPFDKGNETPSTETPSMSTPSTSTPSTTMPAPNLTSAAAGGPPRPEHETDKTGVIGSMGADPKATDIKPTSASTEPSAPESDAAPMQKQQGAANPTDAPAPAAKKELNIDDIDGEELVKNHDPNDHSGEPMHMHGGGAEEKVEKKATKLEERRESKAGQPGGQDMGKEEHGTGEQWVKTTGMASEGGDFDATKPGAGREADRLMEQKGIHKTMPDAKADEPSHSPSPSDTKEKVSLSEKLKTKLHIGHHKDKE